MALPDSTSGVVYGSGQPYYDNLMTNWFLKAFPDAKNNSTVLLQLIEKSPMETVGGKFIVFPVSHGRNTGVQNIGLPTGSAYPAIPVAGRQNSSMMATTTRQHQGSIAIDGAILRNAKTNGGAYLDAVMMETEKWMDDFKVDRERQLENDGSGRLAEVASVSTTTITLKVNSSIEGATNTAAAGTLDQSGWLDIGQRVAFITNDGSPTPITIDGTQEGVYIVALSTSGTTVTMQVALTPGGTAVDVSAELTAGDWIVRAADDQLSSYIDTSWRSEITGMAAIYSDANVLDGVGVTSASQQGSFRVTETTGSSFQGVAVSGNTWNQGIVLDNAGAGNRSITYELVQKAFSDAERINGANITILRSGYFLYDKYVQLAIPDKRYNDTLNLQTGHTQLSVNGTPWIKSRLCYRNRLYLHDLSPLALLETQSLQPLNAGDMATWERVYNSSGQPIDKYWRGWVGQDQLAVVNGVRNRTGAVLTELAD